MANLLNVVKQMTCGRERPLLEVALAEGLLALTKAKSVSIYKLQETPEEAFVWPAVVATPANTQLLDNGLSMPESISSLERFPLLSACLSTGSRLELEEHTFLPIRMNTRSFGVIDIDANNIEPVTLSACDSLLSIFVDIVDLLDYSEIDTLTGLLNRKTFDEYLSRILATLSAGDDSQLDSLHVPRRRRGRSQVHDHWLGVIDIDHFKNINDTFGHSIGDEVLLLLATMLKSSFRTYDKLFRFGGEEFVVLLKPTEEHHAQAVFERFRKAIAQRDFPLVGHVTVSIGFARIGPKDQPTAIFDRADEALYWIKEHGRNQSCYYDSLLASGALKEKVNNPNVEFF